MGWVHNDVAYNDMAGIFESGAGLGEEVAVLLPGVLMGDCTEPDQVRAAGQVVLVKVAWDEIHATAMAETSASGSPALNESMPRSQSTQVPTVRMCRSRSVARIVLAS